MTIEDKDGQRAVEEWVRMLESNRLENRPHSVFYLKELWNF